MQQGKIDVYYWGSETILRCAICEALTRNYNLELKVLNSPKNISPNSIVLIPVENEKDVALAKEVALFNRNSSVFCLFIYVCSWEVAQELKANEVKGILSIKALSEIRLILQAFDQMLDGKHFFDHELVASRFKYETIVKPANLTDREESALKMVLERKSNKEIAVALNVSLESIKKYKQNLRSKLKAATTEELLAKFGVSP